MKGKPAIVAATIVTLAGAFLVATALAAHASGDPNAGCNQDPYTTGSGANHSGPYDDTCDGSASLNGSDTGTATGKPCAGCVGKADEKNPPGQYDNGSDSNAGKECDSNNGIGQTNPAHTACPSPNTTSDGGATPDTSTGGASGGTDPAAPVTGSVGTPSTPSGPTLVAAGTSAGDTAVLGEQFSRSGVAPAAAPSGLAATGVAPLVVVMWLALACAASGTSLRLLARG